MPSKVDSGLKGQSLVIQSHLPETPLVLDSLASSLSISTVLQRMFTVPKLVSSMPQLMMDLSCLNEFIEPFQFHMLIFCQVCLTLQLEACFATLDLERAYWHIPFSPRYWQRLAIQWGDCIFQFTFLPFGLNFALRVFTKMIKPIRLFPFKWSRC